MKIRATSSLKFVNDEKTKLDLKPAKGETLSNVIDILSDFSDDHKWHGTHSQESAKLTDGQLILVDSSFGVRPAVVHAYPMNKGFQDLITGTDDGEKDSAGNVFTVTGWRYLPIGKTKNTTQAFETVSSKKSVPMEDYDAALA